MRADGRKKKNVDANVPHESVPNRSKADNECEGNENSKLETRSEANAAGSGRTLLIRSGFGATVESAEPLQRFIKINASLTAFR